MALDISKIQRGGTSAKQRGATSGFAEFMSKDIVLFGSRFSDKKKEFFYSEMYLLLSSGVDIKTSLDILIEQSAKPDEQKLLQQLTDAIVKGASFSKAMEVCGKFSNYEIFSVQIGEEGGTLSDVLKALHLFYDRKVRQKRQLVNSFSYPVLVLSMAVAAVAFMIHFMVPMFVDVFMRFDAELPVLTRFVVDASEAVSASFWWVLLALVSVWALYWRYRKKPAVRKTLSAVLLKIPLVGLLVRLVYLQRFYQAMALLMASHTPVLRALSLVKNMVGFYQLEIAIEKIGESVMHGQLLNQSMKPIAFFDARAVSLVKLAEEVNSLDTVFGTLNQRTTDELEHRMSVLSNIMEPLLILFVGLLVAVILVSMYLPMFTLSTTVY